MKNYSKLLNETISVSKFCKALQNDDAASEEFITFLTCIGKVREFTGRPHSAEVVKTQFDELSESEFCAFIALNLTEAQKKRFDCFNFAAKVATVAKKKKIKLLD